MSIMWLKFDTSHEKNWCRAIKDDGLSTHPGKAISHIHRNRTETEKLKCLNTYECFHICAETEPKTCTNKILIFSVSAAQFQQVRQVILIKAALTQPRGLFITKLPWNHWWIAQRDNCAIIYEHDSTAFCGTRPRATIKTTNLWQWHGKIWIVKEFLLSDREISPNYTGIFLDFVHGFGSYVNGLPKTKRCNSVAVKVRFGFGFGVYV